MPALYPDAQAGDYECHPTGSTPTEADSGSGDPEPGDGSGDSVEDRSPGTPTADVPGATAALPGRGPAEDEARNATNEPHDAERHPYP